MKDFPKIARNPQDGTSSGYVFDELIKKDFLDYLRIMTPGYW
jgi:hypothetical protein